MTLQRISQRGWTRLFLADPGDAELAERTMGPATATEQRIPLRFVTVDRWGAQLAEVTVVLRGDELITCEPGDGLPLLQDVAARLLWQDPGEADALRAGAEIVRAGFGASAASLTRIESEIRGVRLAVSDLEAERGPEHGISVSDLPRVSEQLVDIDAVLSHVAAAVSRLGQFARLLRREAAVRAADERAEFDALIQQGDALATRLEFLVDRHRFHSRGTAQRISTSDLNIVKIFTVLWAILIPGTTLINWYGQNFEFMPELSWDLSAWIQIAGVFCLAVLPISTVKRAGQLR